MATFGIFMNEKDLDFLLNNIFVIGRFYTHKCRFLKVPPRFIALKNDAKVLGKKRKIEVP